MPLNRAWIASHIPHHGRMCLLDAVLDWNSERITVRTASHRDADNPLRARGRLGIACGIEYAAQAMAVHGALTAGALADSPGAGAAVTAGATPAGGMLAGVRGVRFHALFLDDVPGDLECEALRVAGDSVSALYEFAVKSDARCLLTGRATVLLRHGFA